MPEEISCALSVGHVVANGERIPLFGLLRFDPADPLAVTLFVRTGDGTSAEWTFARDLLASGTERPAGLGDVRVRPSRGDKRSVVMMTLVGPNGPTILELPAHRVDAFVRQTYLAVPSELEASLIGWQSELEFFFGPGKRACDSSPDE
jgi:hypothetical protein